MKFILEAGADLKPVATYHDFRTAVRMGQRTYGYGTFHVACPSGYSPSREEQLLIEEDEEKPYSRKLQRKAKHLRDTL